MSLDAARDLFERFKAEGAELVLRYIQNDEDEHPLFDFKQMYDLKAFAKATSAFGNNRGGVLIWGVEKKNGQPAKDARIEGLKAFVERLNDQTTNLSTPVLDIESVGLEVSDNQGYAVTFIPESKVKPVISQPEQKFFFRTGSNATPMDYKWIQSMFLATASPNLEIELVERHFGSDHASSTHWWYVFKIRNVGLVPAKNLALICNSKYESKKANFVGCRDYFKSPERATLLEPEHMVSHLEAFVLKPNGDTILYPGTEVKAVRLAFVPDGMWFDHRVRIWMYAEGYSDLYEIVIHDDKDHTVTRLDKINAWDTNSP